MVDLHIHILPGMDDGAETMEDALEMARSSVESGVDTVAASSHGNFDGYEPEELFEQYEEKFQAFRAKLSEEKIRLQVCRGMEWLVDDRLLDYIRKRRLPTINGGGYLLVEFYFDSSRRYVMSALDKLSEAGYRLILAHPERYDFARKSPESLIDLYRQEIILQVNKGSLLGEFGRRAFRAADYMLAKGLAGIVASDAHDPVLRSPDLEETARILDLHYGSDASEILLEETPLHILGKQDKLGMQDRLGKQNKEIEDMA